MTRRSAAMPAQPRTTDRTRGAGRGGALLTFGLGALAGLLVAAVALAAALRQPGVLDHLGLAPKADAAVQVVRRPEPTCAPAAAAAPSERSDMLFEPRRLWFVKP